MPEEKYSYTVERNGPSLVDGWRLRQYRDGEQIKTGVFTPNGGSDSADKLARDNAHDVGRQWVEDNTPEAEISW